MDTSTHNTIDELRKVFLNENQTFSLPERFNALFSLKILGSQGDSTAIDLLAQGFQDTSELLKHEIAYVLGQTQNKSAIPHLENTLRNPSQALMVRHEAAEALGALNSRQSLPLLTFFCHQDPSEIIRQSCDLAICRIEWAHSDHAKTEPPANR